MKYNFYIYLAVMAGVTYLIRLLPILFVRQKVKNKFINSFLYYLPPSVLTVMTVPAIFYATNTVWSAFSGFLVAIIMAYRDKSLIKIAVSASLAVFLTETFLRFI